MKWTGLAGDCFLGCFDDRRQWRKIDHEVACLKIEEDLFKHDKSNTRNDEKSIVVMPGCFIAGKLCHNFARNSYPLNIDTCITKIMHVA